MKIILKSKEGNIAIMTLVGDSDKEEAIKKFKESHPDLYTDYYEYDGELPTNRDFRDAWTFKNNKVVVDDKKALQIHMDRIRQSRDSKLEELDKEQLRYFSDSNKIKEIESKKQILRDLPNKWNSLEWPQELS